jgi:acyl-CoA thioester hydrolase
MSIPAPLSIHRDVVRPEWIDYNGHMNVAYYLLAFDQACDTFLDFIGMDAPFRKRTGGTTFAVDCHLTYQREVSAGDPLRFESQLLAFNDKRIHHFHRMYHAEQEYLAATCEWLSLYVDLRTRRVATLPKDIAARLSAVSMAHKALGWPPEAGRGVGLRARERA